MEITFVNPGVDYMIQRIMDFQTEDALSFWSEPLYHFYPQLDKAYAVSLPPTERRNYIERVMRNVYAGVEDTICEKTVATGMLARRKSRRPYQMLLMWIVSACLTTCGAM